MSVRQLQVVVQLEQPDVQVPVSLLRCVLEQAAVVQPVVRCSAVVLQLVAGPFADVQFEVVQPVGQLPVVALPVVVQLVVALRCIGPPLPERSAGQAL